MTIATTSNTTTAQGNGATTVFNYGFLMDDAGHAVIIYTDVLGVPHTLAVGQYVLTGVGNPLGGTVTYNPAGVPIPNGSTLTISRQVPYVQGTSIDNQGNFYPAVVEAAMDYLTMQTQQISQLLSRTPTLPANLDATLYTMTLPNPVANAAIGWDPTGKKLANIQQAGGIATSGFGQSLVNTVDNIAARVLLGTGIWCGVAGGTANALTLTPTSPIAGYNTGDTFVFKTGAAANNAATTINISGKGVVNARSNDAAMVGGELVASRWHIALYDGANFQVSRFAPVVVAGTDNQALLTDSSTGSGFRYVTLGAGSVRQSVQQGVVDNTAVQAAAFLTTGAGLRPGLSATSRALVVAFAAGFSQAGAADFVSTISADVADPLGVNLPLSNMSFLRCDYTSPVAMSYGSTLVPPQYGYGFDRTKQSLLNFEGINGAVTTTDDFGTAWTLTGATITTAQFKFGASSLDCTGGAKYATSTGFTSLGEGSWETSFWFRINALPGVGTAAILMYAGNAGSFGAVVYLNNVAGTTKLGMNLSSTGAANDIGTPAGTNTVWALNQWNKVRLVFDALAGTYRVYLSLNGAAETQDINQASTARISAITQIRLGADQAAAQTFNGWFDAFRFLPCATNTTTETPSAVAPTVTDYPIHFFRITEMRMYEVTGLTAGIGDPVMVARNRCFLGEADTSGAAVTAVRSYAIRGEYYNPNLGAMANGTVITFSDNLGVKEKVVEGWIEALTTQNGFGVGQRLPTFWDGNAGTGANLNGFTVDILSKNISRFFVHNTITTPDYTNGLVQTGITLANWKPGVRVRRAF